MNTTITSENFDQYEFTLGFTQSLPFDNESNYVSLIDGELNYFDDDDVENENGLLVGKFLGYLVHLQRAEEDAMSVFRILDHESNLSACLELFKKDELTSAPTFYSDSN